MSNEELKQNRERMVNAVKMYLGVLIDDETILSEVYESIDSITNHYEYCIETREQHVDLWKSRYYDSKGLCY